MFFFCLPHYSLSYHLLKMYFIYKLCLFDFLMVANVKFMWAKLWFAGGPSGATETNVEEYMEKLKSLATDTKGSAVVKQARDIINKLDLPTN